MSSNPTTNLVSVTPTLNASGAYSSGQCIGGLVEFANAITQQSDAVGGGGAILSLVAVDLQKQNSQMSIFIFNKKPTGTYTDQTTLNVSAADLANCLGIIPVAAADYVSAGTAGSVATEKSIGLSFDKPTGQTSIFALISTTGTPTWTGQNLILKIGVLND